MNYLTVEHHTDIGESTLVYNYAPHSSFDFISRNVLNFLSSH